MIFAHQYKIRIHFSILLIQPTAREITRVVPRGRFLGMRDRKTVFIFDELVMRPFDIAKGPPFPVETFYYLLSIPLHEDMLIANKKMQLNTQNIAQKLLAGAPR